MLLTSEKADGAWGRWHEIRTPDEVRTRASLAAAAIDEDRVAVFVVIDGGNVRHGVVRDGALDGDWVTLPSGGRDHTKVPVRDLSFGSIAAASDEERSGVHAVSAHDSPPGVRHAWSYDIAHGIDGSWEATPTSRAVMFRHNAGIAATPVSGGHMLVDAYEPLDVRMIQLPSLRQDWSERLDCDAIDPDGNIAISTYRLGLVIVYIGLDRTLHAIERPVTPGASVINVQTEERGQIYMQSWTGQHVWANENGGVRADGAELDAQSTLYLERVEVQQGQGDQSAEVYALRTTPGGTSPSTASAPAAATTSRRASVSGTSTACSTGKTKPPRKS